jgi:excisionase family DNA binding protein
MADSHHRDRNLLTPGDVQQKLRVNVRTLYRLMRAGILPALRVGRQWRVRRADLDAWLRPKQPAPPWDRSGPDDTRGQGPAALTPRVPAEPLAGLCTKESQT